MSLPQQFSSFGNKLGSETGIEQLMTDLGEAMSGAKDVLMLGGGNPAHISAMNTVWRKRMQEILDTGAPFDNMLANYDTPKGRPAFISAITHFLKNKYGWNISEENIAITAGSQSAFFALFNMLAGKFDDGSNKHILLPVAPEYIGYADQGISPCLFRSVRPIVSETRVNEFKYSIDFKTLSINKDTAAIAISRPTNPSGNVITDDEVSQLSALTKKAGIPLIIDNAYGAPFPNIIFTPAKLIWDEHIVLSISLSKLGLPGTRTGIIIANKEIARRISAISAIIGLANNNIGQEITWPLVGDGTLEKLCAEHVTGFYLDKAKFAVQTLKAAMPAHVPYALHKCEGSMFLWLWLKELPITSQELYVKLKNSGVVVVSGHHFFFGLDSNDWPHSRQCLRINYSQPQHIVEKGLKIIAEVVGGLY